MVTALGEETTTYNLSPGLQVTVQPNAPSPKKALAAKKAIWASQNQLQAPASFDRFENPINQTLEPRGTAAAAKASTSRKLVQGYAFCSIALQLQPTSPVSALSPVRRSAAAGTRTATRPVWRTTRPESSLVASM